MSCITLLAFHCSIKIPKAYSINIILYLNGLKDAPNNQITYFLTAGLYEQDTETTR